VKEKLGLSFNNIRALHKLVDAIPDRAGDWRTTNLSFSDRPSEKHTIRYCNMVDAIKCLWGDPALSKHMVYAPKKIFSDATKANRIYSEMWTGSWWHVIQVSHFNPTVHIFSINSYFRSASTIKEHQKQL
jgi:hypothetical protein